MVRPVYITITADQVGLNEIDIPELSGFEIMVQRGTAGNLKPDVDFAVNAGGGFRLLKEDDKFVLNETFTITPLPVPIAPPFSIPIYPTTQYPHVLTLKTVSSSTQDENGNWVNGSETTVQMACRAEPNNKNAFVKGDDGNQVVYDFTVYMPLPVETIKTGTEITVMDGDEVLCNNSVKRFSRGQLNARLWL